MIKQTEFIYTRVLITNSYSTLPGLQDEAWNLIIYIGELRSRHVIFLTLSLILDLFFTYIHMLS